MKKVSKMRINKLIARTYFEMFLVVFLAGFSYFAFSTSNLTSSAMIAEQSSTEDYQVQVMYGRNVKNENEVLSKANLLDEGVLTVRNPSKNDKKIEVKMILDNQGFGLNMVRIEVDGNEVDTSSVTIKDGKYVIAIDHGDLKSYENMKRTVSIYGDSNMAIKLDYTFEVNESFYS